jgi:arsenate reductase (thioredoxin)
MEESAVLFLCTGNSARSQMAEAFLRKWGAGRYAAHSAGLDPRPIDPRTVQVMAEIGCDLSGQRSKDIREYLGKRHFQYLITVCDKAEQNCPRIWPGVTARLHWSFEDPVAFSGTEEEPLAKFREVRDQIEARVRAFVEVGA